MAVCCKERVFVKPLSELRLSSHTIIVTSASMAVTSAQFLWFLQNEGNGLKEMKIIPRMGIFLNTDVISLILQQLFDKLRLSQLEKLSFKWTNIILEIGGTI